MNERKLTDEQLTELQSGDGVYYIPQETAFCPGISGEWPSVIKHPTNKNGRLVKRQSPIKPLEYAQTGHEPNAR